MVRRRAAILRLAGDRLSAAGVPQELRPAPRLPRRTDRPDGVAAELLLRVPEIREAVRNAARRPEGREHKGRRHQAEGPLTRCSPCTSTPRGPGAADRTRC